MVCCNTSNFKIAFKIVIINVNPTFLINVKRKEEKTKGKSHTSASTIHLVISTGSL